MSHWIDQLLSSDKSQPSVIVTVARVRGSAPREVGAKMIVGADTTSGTIGGGELELQCQQIAEQRIRSVSDNRKDTRQVRNFALGTNCGQCCGGAVDVMFETVFEKHHEWLSQLALAREAKLEAVIATPLANPQAERTLFTVGDPTSNPVTKRSEQLLNSGGAAKCARIKMKDGSTCNYLLEPVRAPKRRIAIFGAGHVGTALVTSLRNLDCQIQWIDSRAELLEATDFNDVNRICVANPVGYVPHILPETSCLIMTHSHALDFDLCTQLLQRSDITFCGLIGSRSKRKRFERLFKQAELPQDCLQRLTCPIGIDGVSGKTPAEIAISVAAQLLQLETIESKVTNPTAQETTVAALPH